MLAVVFLGTAVAGVLFANHEGIIDIPFLKSNQSEQQSVSGQEDNHITEEGFSPETAYSAILKTYKDAFANNYYLIVKMNGTIKTSMIFPRSVQKSAEALEA